jgi:Domain of unknown function (DUF4115)
VGRHTVPGSGAPEPDRGFWVRLGIGTLVGLLAVGWFLTRGGDDEVGTTGTGAGSPSAGTTTSAAAPAPSSPSPSTGSTSGSPSPSPSSTRRPPTLAFTVRYPAYITVRVPGGRTLVSKLYKAGAKASFDQKLLEVVNGRPQAVRFVVNGKPRKPGPTGQTETFIVRRR